MKASLMRSLLATVSLVGIATLAACSGSETPFDPVALSQNTDQVINTMDNSPAMQSMGVLGEKMTAGAPAMGAAAFIAATLPTVPVRGGGFAAWASLRMEALQAALPSLSVASPEAVIIPTLVLGKTFTYNSTTSQYQLSDRTGGPSNGVRFILYAVNPLTHEVTAPLSEIGYADLMDESASTTSLKLHLKAYDNALAQFLIDYTASATVQGTPPSSVTGATVTVTGNVSDGTTTVEFDLSQSLSTTTGISVNYSLSVPEKDVEVTFQATFTVLRQASVTLTVKNGGNTTIAAVSGTTASITGTIKHNGTVVVNVSGTPDNPVFTDASGTALTEQQLAALKKLFDFVDKLQQHVDDMMAPSYLLLGLTFFFA